MGVKAAFVLIGAMLGAVSTVAILVFVMGEIWPTLPYEDALPYVLVGGIIGTLAGGYLGNWIARRWKKRT
jgi:hypothetical protein